MEDDLDKLIKHTLNNIAERINFSEPDKLLNRIHQEILKNSPKEGKDNPL